MSSLIIKETGAIPAWLAQLLDEMEKSDNFSNNLDDWPEFAQKSKEYLCRSFQKYLNTTPTTHMNSLRLYYAANLLTHTSHDVLQIVFEAGFQSASHFYHLFKAEYGVPPLKFKENNSFHFKL